MKCVTLLIYYVLFCFKLKIVLQGHGTRVNAKSQPSGEKAFRCDYDGCGKLYTTAHHLKVMRCKMSVVNFAGMIMWLKVIEINREVVLIVLVYQMFIGLILYPIIGCPRCFADFAQCFGQLQV